MWSKIVLETNKDDNKKLETEIDTDDKRETGNKKVMEKVSDIMEIRNDAPIGSS